VCRHIRTCSRDTRVGCIQAVPQCHQESALQQRSCLPGSPSAGTCSTPARHVHLPSQRALPRPLVEQKPGRAGGNQRSSRMGCSCYWGLATRQNQLAWLCLVACIIIGASLWIPGAVETRRCSLQYHETCRECIESTSTGRWPCSASQQAALDERCWAKYMNCIRTPAIVWAIGGFFLVVLIWIPGCYICCSARAPLDSQEGGGMYAPGTQDVQVRRRSMRRCDTILRYGLRAYRAAPYTIPVQYTIFTVPSITILHEQEAPVQGRKPSAQSCSAGSTSRPDDLPCPCPADGLPNWHPMWRLPEWSSYAGVCRTTLRARVWTAAVNAHVKILRQSASGPTPG
jgi:hypothetical protein